MENDNDQPEQATSGTQSSANLYRFGLGAIVLLLFALVVFASLFRRPLSAPNSDSDSDLGRRPKAVVDSGRLLTPRLESMLSRQNDSLDPHLDGWDSEAVTEAVDAQLKQIGKFLSDPASQKPEKLRSLCTDDFSCPPLRPRDLQDVFVDKSIQVQRPATVQDTVEHHSLDGLVEALRQLAEPLTGGTDVRTKFKTIRVRLLDEDAETTAYFQLSSLTPDGYWQINATWDCQWSRGRPGNPPRLSSIRVRDYEQIVGVEGPLFADCTEAVLGHNASFDQQIRYGLIHWLKRIERLQVMWVYARNGLAVGDVNGDGLDDLYLCQPGGLPNRLYVQNPDGTATDCSESAGVDWLDQTASALLVDLDNDGDQDLLAVIRSKLLLMENDSTGHFDLAATLEYVDTDGQSLSAVDYDNDGDLDLYLCVGLANRVARADEDLPEFNYHDAREGGANILFRNDISETSDGWTFTDVTEATGLEADNRRHSLAASWEDYNNDGHQDLYVANDYGPNWLYRNDNGQFVDVAPEKGLLDVGSGMSVSWADYNRDGHLDLYVANMFSSAGNRITRQARFKTDDDPQMRAIYTRLAKGNTLFEGSGETGDSDGPGFAEVGAEAGVEMGRWAWSSPFVDLNNDGWEDIVVANGFHSGEDETKDL